MSSSIVKRCFPHTLDHGLIKNKYYDVSLMCTTPYNMFSIHLKKKNPVKKILQLAPKRLILTGAIKFPSLGSSGKPHFTASAESLL